MIYSRIVGTGSYLPPRVMTNADFAARLDTTDAWIRERTGIVQRHIAEKSQTSSDLAFEASRHALAAAGVGAEDMDLIVVATSTPDYVFPSTACLLQSKLGVKGSAAFDVQAVCSGFVYGLATADNFIRAGAAKKALVVGAEVFSRILDWNDRGTCVLFGDGAGAVVLQRTDRPGGLRSFVLGSDGCGAPRLFVPAGGSKLPASQESVEARSHFLQMEGSNVFRFATKVIPGSIVEALEKAGLTSADLGLVIPHQANIRIIDHAREKLNLPAERVFTNVDRYGNTSAASIPVALCEALEEGRIKERDIVAMCAFGAGLCWAAAVWEWN